MLGLHPMGKGRVYLRKIFGLIALLAVTGLAGSLWADNFSGTTNTTTVSTVSKTKSKTNGKLKIKPLRADGHHVNKTGGTAHASAGKTNH
jgi:hypothetical protein